jgi:hypothetical protein
MLLYNILFVALVHTILEKIASTYRGIVGHYYLGRFWHDLCSISFGGVGMLELMCLKLIANFGKPIKRYL